MTIVLEATGEHVDEWSRLRAELWPEDTKEAHAEDLREWYLGANPDRAAFVATASNDTLSGFAEATMRRDYVEGCSTSPVVFLEGIYVKPTERGKGIARALSAAVREWGRARGATEFASNALIGNEDSHAFHTAVGFEETLRVVFFCQKV
ncbi:MAG: GNAT family N-acetyltransferase [Erythrobacter sp.]|uniref:aminoglycoside 6'-N-acetyltransferase n=1 Tax=Erythrobacter sp. TaxID=1042 RepID=UPI00260710CF|nr:aminoglycoside 6'-N-acetyltransferase [Erythrobacter sp.]MDJ0977036.1 GNAT family N-acetyltransferase [Erythrobacter sp.]